MYQNAFVKIASIVGILIVHPLFAFDGTGTSGGGSLVNVGGKVELADNFVRPKKVGTPFRLSADLRAYLENTKELLSRYGLKNDGFWSETVFGDSAEYRLLKENELPCKDEPLPVRDPNLKQETYGCTTPDKTTYLIESKFKALDTKRQALAIMHERFHAADPKASHIEIADFIFGTYTLITIKDEQAAGNIRELEVEELEAIKDLMALNGKSFFVLDKEYEFINLQRYGGLFSRTFNIIDSILGVGTIISFNRVTPDGLLDFYGLVIIKNSTILNSNITSDNHTIVEIYDSMIFDSHLTTYLQPHETRPFLLINNSKLMINNSKIIKSYVSRSTLKYCNTSEGTSVVNAKLIGNKSAPITIENNAKISDTNITLLQNPLLIKANSKISLKRLRKGKLDSPEFIFSLYNNSNKDNPEQVLNLEGNLKCELKYLTKGLYFSNRLQITYYHLKSMNSCQNLIDNSIAYIP